jgi:hypothetical protein
MYGAIFDAIIVFFIFKIKDINFQYKTQVSFDPPPWEEFTTKEPFRKATRVKPPGITSTPFP